MSASATAPRQVVRPAASGARAALSSKQIGIALLALAILFPFLDTALGLNLMNPMLRILTSVMLALGLNIVVGFAGLLDLGYVAFWAIGAYVVGWLASGHFATIKFHVMSGIAPTMPGIHVSIWLLFLVAMAVTAFFGVLLGAPTLRLRGDYLAIVTLGFGEIVPKLFQNGDDIFGHNLTNGTRGISGLDTPVLGGAMGESVLGQGWGVWGPINLQPWYYLGLMLVVVCWYISYKLQWARLGRAWMAIREDEIAASAMGINLVQTKLWAYGIGASLGGLAGVYHGARIGSIFPSSFMFYISISLLCMVIIGGMGNIWGAILGAVAIEGLNFWLLPSLTTWSNAAGLNVDFSSYNLMIFGVLLVVMMLYRPQGFLPAKARRPVPEDDPLDVAHVHAPMVDDDGFPPALHGPVGEGGHPVLTTDAHLPDIHMPDIHVPSIHHPHPKSRLHKSDVVHPGIRRTNKPGAISEIPKTGLTPPSQTPSGAANRYVPVEPWQTPPKFPRFPTGGSQPGDTPVPKEPAP